MNQVFDAIRLFATRRISMTNAAFIFTMMGMTIMGTCIGSIITYNQVPVREVKIAVPVPFPFGGFMMRWAPTNQPEQP